MTVAAENAAKVLGGRPSGGGQWLASCPVPSHGKGRGDRNPSLSLKDGDDGKLLWNCLGGCDKFDVFAELRRLGLLVEDDRQIGFSSQVAMKTRQRSGKGVPDWNTLEPDAAALALWRSSRMSTDDSLVRLYLSQHRAFPGEIPPSIRYALGAEYRPASIRLPAMVAAVQRPDRRIIACQATYLRASDGAKAPVSVPRMTVGALGDGAVRLGAAGPTL